MRGQFDRQRDHRPRWEQLLYCRHWAAQGDAVGTLAALVERGNRSGMVCREDNKRSRKETT